MDEELWVGVIVLGGFAGTFGLIIWLIVVTSRKSYENICYLAERLGFEIPAEERKFGFYNSPDIVGEVRGKQVRLYTYTTGSGKSKSTWAAVSVVPLEHGGLTFSLSRQGFGTRVLELFGAKEIQVGDEVFDREWFIQTNAPDYLAMGLLPEMRQKIQTTHGKWKLAEGEILYVEKGSFSSRTRCDQFVEIVDAACDLADAAEVYAKQT